MKIMVVNVGSTSLKLKVYEMDGISEAATVLAHGKVERIGQAASPLSLLAGGEKRQTEIRSRDHEEAIAAMLSLLAEAEGGREFPGDIAGIGFKAVHAGEHTQTSIVDEELLARMEAFCDAAPAHNPPYIKAMRGFRKLLPATPLVAVFETAFHSGIPDYAYIYSSPYEWYEKHGIRRYGFHGASLRYVSERVRRLVGQQGRPSDPPVSRLIACHLGGSSSVCAIRDGRSIDTSMGFTLQAGVPMNNRCGDIDPFIIPVVLEREKLSVAEVTRQLTQNAGLLGISGLSADVRDLETAAAQGHARAELALNVFAYSVKKYIGAYAAALGGVDTLAFSGGIGERSVDMRRRICRGLEFLGIALDEERNAGCVGDERLVSRDGSPVRVYVVPTDEEIVVARETLRRLG